MRTTISASLSGRYLLERTMSGRVLIDKKAAHGESGLRLLRDWTSEQLSDVGSGGGAQDDFGFSATTMALDHAVLMKTSTSGMQVDRTARHIARGGMHHYQVTLCLNGQTTVAAGRRTATLQPGDLCLIDMAQPSRTVMSADNNRDVSRELTLVLPRPLLGPLLAAPDAMSAASISRHSRHGKLLAEHLLALCRDCETGSNSANGVNHQVLASLVADALGSAADAEDAVGRANRQALLASIKRYIDANLQTPRLDTEHLCDRFKISRATLYRLFEEDNGLWRYVHDQRLNRALAMLASPAAGQAPISTIAGHFQFGSATSFVRAFRRRFGATPGEIRRLAELNRQLDMDNSADGLLWLRRLG